jgi:hypothetical protein
MKRLYDESRNQELFGELDKRGLSSFTDTEGLEDKILAAERATTFRREMKFMLAAMYCTVWHAGWMTRNRG